MTSDDTQLDETPSDGPFDPLGEHGESIDRAKVRRATRLLLEAIGEQPDRDGLVETWQRRVPQLFETLSEGTRAEERPTMRTFDAPHDDPVVKTGIPIYSLCEHHLLPYHGAVHVAYRPVDEVVGLSKLSRYVRWQSRRLTMQEQLTRDIATGLADELDADTVLVELSATHLCEAMRGIETETTTTQATVGSPTSDDRQRFRDAIAREEKH